MKKFFIGTLLLFVCAIAIILFRTLTLGSKQPIVKIAAPSSPRVEALENFQTSIRFRTVSHSDSTLFDSAQFLALHRFLEEKYPAVHRKMVREIVHNYTLLFHWEGKNSNLQPVVLMAHQDVVPIEDGTESIWTVDPFAGIVKDDFVWGRGATDDKINLISILESAEKLILEGFQPERTIYLVFGHDEEIGGRGAQSVVRIFKERGIKPDLVLDEGGIVTREKVPGLTRNVALLGTSEKGILTIELKVEKAGGHSAMPERETAIDILARAISRLNENKFEPRFSESVQDFIKSVGPDMPFVQKMAFANLWLFRPMVHSIYEKSGPGNAMIRTTMVPTILRSGVKENVVPTLSTAILNLRLLPGDSAKAIQEKIRKIVNDDRVQVVIRDSREATPVTSMETFAYKTVDNVIRHTYDSVIATPFLMIGATDSRYFHEISSGVIKFSPMVDPIGFHGIDERVSIDSFNKSMHFFEQLMHGL